MGRGGQWYRFGKTNRCVGFSLEIGEIYRCSIIQRDDGMGQPIHWEAGINLHKLGPFPDKDTAVRAIEFELEQGMKKVSEDWAVFQATKILATKRGKKVSQDLPMPQYSLDDLKQKLGSSGWRTNPGSEASSPEGTLKAMIEAAHERHAKGQAVGHLEEIETEIKVDLLQLQDLWRHMGLPTI